MGLQSSSKSNSSQEIQTPQDADADVDNSGITGLLQLTFTYV